jgi:hypothetical protein
MTAAADGHAPHERVSVDVVRGDEEPGPGGTPSIKIALVAEITGEWIEPAVIAETARTLADNLAGSLRAAAARIDAESPP